MSVETSGSVGGAPATGASGIASGSGQAPTQTGAGQANASAATSGTSGSGATAAGSPDWTSSLPEDVRGFVQTKGFRNPGDVIDSYRGLEKLMGAKEKLVRLPDNMEEAGAMEAIYDRLGRPTSPDAYKFDKDADPKIKDWAKEAFYKNGLSAKQAENIVQGWNDHLRGEAEASEAKIAELGREQTRELQKEWGAAFKQNIDVAKRGANALGIGDEATIHRLEEAIGFKKLANVLHKVGQMTAEGQFHSGQSQNSFNVPTPEMAKVQINALKNDQAFLQKYMNGDKTAKAEMEKLHRYAYPDMG